MIHIKIDDTIVDIVDKMSEVGDSDIILDFPLGHPILHNYISLKILKSKADNRNLIIATSDKIGKKIGKKLGIQYSVVKSKKFIENTSQKNLLGYNYTFWEYLKFQVSSYKNEIVENIQNHKQFHALGKYSRASYEKVPVTFFIAGFFLSLILFLFIYYFAISKTYIYISPDIIVKKQAYNFIFTPNIPSSVLGNNKYVKVETISKTLYSSDTYAATEIIENDNVSTGEITLFNRLKEKQTLVPNTRVVSDDGLIFRTNSWIEIPAATIDNFGNLSPGTIGAIVTSDTKDLSGNYIGERGNIGSGVNLILPGLDVSLQSELYAVSKNNFTGGNNNFQKIVSQEDIDRASELFLNKIKNEVIVSIKNSILLRNNENNTKIDILPGSQSILFSNPVITILDGVKSGDQRENFNIEGNITATVYTYNKETVIQRLQTLLNEKKLVGVEKIDYIDESSLRMSEVIYSEQKPFSLKSTFEIEAIYSHDFQHKDNTFIELLKQQIRGMPKNEAENLLLNNPKISKVTIDIRPFFSKNISNIYNNIIFNLE